MSDYEIKAAIRMADEIAGNLRKSIADDAERLLNDIRCDVRSQYVYNLCTPLAERATMLNAWMTIAESLRRRLPKPTETDAA